jgi:hypothetical protein
MQAVALGRYVGAIGLLIGISLTRPFDGVPQNIICPRAPRPVISNAALAKFSVKPSQGEEVETYTASADKAQ